jgi:mono/diheme cytochrome c family protein
MRKLLSSAFAVLLCVALSFAQKKVTAPSPHLRWIAEVPKSTHSRRNPYEGDVEAVRAGHKLFEQHCAVCHGADALGRGKAPALNSQLIKALPSGDLFWFLTNGNLWAGMPSWASLPEARRWQIVTYLKTFHESTFAKSVPRSGP